MTDDAELDAIVAELEQAGLVESYTNRERRPIERPFAVATQAGPTEDPT